MSPLGKLISQWRQWINRNKTFTCTEMDELENHLLEEIDDLKQYEGLSEEEAFQKVVSVMGGREALDKEFVKGKKKSIQVMFWVRRNPKKMLTFFSIIIFLCGYLFAWIPLSKETSILKKQLDNIQTFNGPFRAFQTKKKSIPKINKPEIAWKFEWNDVLVRPDSITSLTTDDDNNVYFLANKNLYCLQSDGKTKWIKNNFESDYILPTSEGILVKEWTDNNSIKIVSYDKAGNKKWNINGNYQVIGPDGMIYAEKPYDDYRFFSCDADGKTRWIFTIPEKMRLNSYFFDTEYNVYLIATNTYHHILHLYKFSSRGKLLLERDLSIPKNYMEPIPNGLSLTGRIVKDNFMLLLTFREYKEVFLKKQETNPLLNAEEEDYFYINKLVSFSVEGIEKWSHEVSGDRDFDASHYSIGENGNIYLVYFNSVAKKLNLQFLTNEGKLLLEKAINSSKQNHFLEYETTTILKNDNFLYFGLGGYIYDFNQKLSYKELEKFYSDNNMDEDSKRRIYCYDTDGNLHWSMEQPNPKWQFASYFGKPLELSTNGSILYVENGSLTIYCIQDAERISISK